MEEKIPLKSLVDIKQWQAIQDNLSDVAGISIKTVDVDAKSLTQISGNKRSCGMIQQIVDRKGVDLCKNFYLELIAKFRQNNENIGSECFTGLHHFIVPLEPAQDVAVGYVILGPVILGARKNSKEVEKIAKNIGINPELIMDNLRQIKLLSFNSVEYLLQLLRSVFQYIIQLGYQKLKLEEIIPHLSKADRLVHNFYINRLLDVLLESVLYTTKADIGSVMLIEPNTKQMRISASKGLDKSIVTSTNINVGEGIAGLVALRGKTIVIDKDLDDEEVSGRLKRPSLKTAVVAPLRVENDVMGVVSIASKDPTYAIRGESMIIFDQFVKLTSIAISNLQV